MQKNENDELQSWLEKFNMLNFFNFLNDENQFKLWDNIV